MPNSQNSPDSSAKSTKEQMDKLTTRLYDLYQRFGNVNVAMNNFSNKLNQIAELSGRLASSLMLMIGLPRVMRGDLSRTLIMGGTSGGGSSGSGSGSGKFPTKEERFREWVVMEEWKANYRATKGGSGYDPEDNKAKLKAWLEEKKQMKLASDEEYILAKNLLVKKYREEAEQEFAKKSGVGFPSSLETTAKTQARAGDLSEALKKNIAQLENELKSFDDKTQEEFSNISSRKYNKAGISDALDALRERRSELKARYEADLARQKAELAGISGHTAPSSSTGKKPIIVFDTETTGTNVNSDRIIDLAAVKFNPDGGTEKLNLRMDPERPITNTDIHGITDAQVAGAKKFKDYADKIKKFFEGADVAGFNSAIFDVPLLKEHFKRLGVAFNTGEDIDALNNFRKATGGSGTLGEVYKHYTGKDQVGAHGAMSDVETTIAILKKQGILPDVASASSRPWKPGSDKFDSSVYPGIDNDIILGKPYSPTVIDRADQHTIDYYNQQLASTRTPPLGTEDYIKRVHELEKKLKDLSTVHNYNRWGLEPEAGWTDKSYDALKDIPGINPKFLYDYSKSGLEAEFPGTPSGPVKHFSHYLEDLDKKTRQSTWWPVYKEDIPYSPGSQPPSDIEKLLGGSRKQTSLSDLTKAVSPSPEPSFLDRMTGAFMKGWKSISTKKPDTRTEEEKLDEEKKKKEKEEKLRRAMDSLTITFLGLSAASQALLRAASPDTFSTFTGSLQLLAASIGQGLIPFFTQLSGIIQDISFKFQMADEATKQWIGKIMMGSIAVTGLFVVFRTLAATVSLASLKISLLAGGLALLANQLLSMKRMSDERLGSDKRRNDLLNKEVSKEDVAEDEGLNKLKQYMEEPGLTDKEKKSRKEGVMDALSEHWKIQKAKTEKAIEIDKQLEADPLTATKGTFTKIQDLLGSDIAGKISKFFDFNKGSTAEEVEEGRQQWKDSVAKERRKFQIVDKFYRSLREGEELPSRTKDTTPREEKLRNILYNFQSLKVQPRYSGIEDAYKNIQVEALSKTPLEQALDKMHREGLLKMIDESKEQNGILKSIRDVIVGLGS